MKQADAKLRILFDPGKHFDDGCLCLEMSAF